MDLLARILEIIFMFALVVIWYIWDKDIITIETAVILWVFAAVVIIVIEYLIKRTLNR